MYSKSLITIFATAVTVASALPSSVEFMNRHRRNAIPTQFQERGYAQDADLLEPYDGYHERYLSFKCQNKHNTAFWDQCCHPVLSWQDVKTTLPSTCWDALNEGNGDGNGDGDDCDDGDDGSNPGDDGSNPGGDDGDDDDCDDGDDGGDEPSTTKAPSNPVAQPTKIVTVTTTTTAPASTPTSGGGEPSGNWNGPGYGTWYKQNGNAGACGIVHGEDDLIVAIDIERYGDTGRVSDLCGKKVYIKNKDNGKSVTATIADVCPTCVAPSGGQVKNSIDMSVGTFTKLADLSTGQITIEWKFV